MTTFLGVLFMGLYGILLALPGKIVSFLIDGAEESITHNSKNLNAGYFTSAFKVIVAIALTALNILFVVHLGIGIGWKVFFILMFALAFFSPYQIALSGPFFITCLFHSEVISTMNEHFSPLAKLGTICYGWSDSIHDMNHVVLIIFVILNFIAVISESYMGMLKENDNT